MEPALSDSTVVEKAASAWRHELLGQNAFGKRRTVIIPDKLENASGDALRLYSHLQREHFWRDQIMIPSDYGEPFGMGWRRLRNALGELVKAGALMLVSRGGRFVGDSAVYAWVKTRPD